MQIQSLPEYVTRYFWGDDLHDFDLKQNKKYILRVILEQGDQKAIHWLFSIFGKDDIKNDLPKLSLSKKSENFWKLYLS